MPGNVITETWLAYAFERPVALYAPRIREAAPLPAGEEPLPVPGDGGPQGELSATRSQAGGLAPL